MGFKPGEKRPENAGRKKGSVNRRTLMVIEKLQLMDCDPIAVLALFAKNDWQGLGYQDPNIIPSELRAKCASDLAQYVAPKLKAIEHTGADGEPLAPPISVTDEQLKRMAAEIAEPREGRKG